MLSPDRLFIVQSKEVQGSKPLAPRRGALVNVNVYLGVQAFADALLIIPKSLAQNSGYDRQEVTVKLQAEYSKSKVCVGIDLNTGDPMNPATAGNLFMRCLIERTVMRKPC